MEDVCIVSNNENLQTLLHRYTSFRSDSDATDESRNAISSRTLTKGRTVKSSSLSTASSLESNCLLWLRS